jgi:hypothetical protein
MPLLQTKDSNNFKNKRVLILSRINEIKSRTKATPGAAHLFPPLSSWTFSHPENVHHTTTHKPLPSYHNTQPPSIIVFLSQIFFHDPDNVRTFTTYLHFVTCFTMVPLMPPFASAGFEAQPETVLHASQSATSCLSLLKQDFSILTCVTSTHDSPRQQVSHFLSHQKSLHLHRH